MLLRISILLCVVGVCVGCGDDDGGGTVYVEAGPPPVRYSDCIDDDEDGFGQDCDLGEDCDDGDPDITDECFACTTPNEGCPCEKGSRAVFCKPPDIHVEGGTLVCEEGTRYCQDELWTECVAVGDYTFRPATGE